jgi:hypothetical protein
VRSFFLGNENILQLIVYKDDYFKILWI